MTLTIYNSSGLQKAVSNTVYDTDQIGTVKAYAGATIPANWMLCDGRTLPRTSYTDLFNALGGTSSPWGLPDSTSFSLPDLRSRMVVGTGTGAGGGVSGTGVPTGGTVLTNKTSAQYGGRATVTLDQSTLPTHSHVFTDVADPPFWLVPMVRGGLTARDDFAAGGTTKGLNRNQQSIQSTAVSNISQTADAGSGSPHENMPPWVAVAWIIKAIGYSIDVGGGLIVSSSVIPMDGWHTVGAAGEPAFGAGYAALGGWAAPGFRKDPLGRVHFRGSLSGFNASVPIFTLPVGYRPPASLILDTIGGNNQQTRVNITAAGVVQPVVGEATYVSLDGLSFDTESVTAMPTGPQGAQGPKGDTGPINGIQDEGVALPVRSKINVVGSGVTATDDAANDRINITVATPRVTSLAAGQGGIPAAIPDGFEVRYVADAANGVMWGLRYNASGGTYKWECVGGGEIWSGPQGSMNITAVNVATPLSGGPGIYAPLSGEYIASYGIQAQMNGGNAQVQINLWLMRNGAAASGAATPFFNTQAQYDSGFLFAKSKVAFNAGDAVNVGGVINAGWNTLFLNGILGLVPVRVA